MMASVKTMAATVGAVAASSAALCLLGPPFAGFITAGVPRVYTTLAAWLAPPYLYLLINAIILSIAASSRFQKMPPSPDADDGASILPQPSDLPAADVMVVPLPEYAPLIESETEFAQDVETSSEFYEEEKSARSDRVDNCEVLVKMETRNQIDVEEPVISPADSWTLKRSDSIEVRTKSTPESADKPLVSSRFGGQRKARRPSQDGKEALRRVSQPRRNETLESTWRAITEGRSVPLARHLKKSDSTLSVDVRGDGNDDDSSAFGTDVAPRKCETFNDRASAARSSAGTSWSAASGRRIHIRREPSQGLDELNRRVEAFIKRFNEEMRLQRQESFQQYMDMINSGT